MGAITKTLITFARRVTIDYQSATVASNYVSVMNISAAILALRAQLAQVITALSFSCWREALTASLAFK